MRQLRETRRALLERGRSKHGDATWSAPINDLWREVRDELADVVGWAWVLHTRAAGYPAELRPLVQMECRSVRDRARRCFDLYGAAWEQVFAADVPPCTPRVPSGLVVLVDRGEVLDVRRWPRFASLVVQRLVTGAAKYGDASYLATGDRLVAELGEEVASAGLWLEFVWTRLEAAGVGAPAAPYVAELTSTLTHMYYRLHSLHLVVMQAEEQLEPAQILEVPPPEAVRAWVDAANTSEVRRG